MEDERAIDDVGVTKFCGESAISAVQSDLQNSCGTILRFCASVAVPLLRTKEYVSVTLI